MDAGFVNIAWAATRDGKGLRVTVGTGNALCAAVSTKVTAGDRAGVSWLEPNGAAARVIVTYHGNRSGIADGFDPDVTVTCDGPVQLVAPDGTARVTFRTRAPGVTVWGMDRRWRRETTDEPGAFEWATTGPRFAKVLEVER